MINWIIENWEGIITAIILIAAGPIITYGARMTRS